jgi:LasA protease
MRIPIAISATVLLGVVPIVAGAVGPATAADPVAVAVTRPAAPPTPAPAPTPSATTLIAAVAARAAQASGATPHIEVEPRSTADWGFGSAVVDAPAAEGAYPDAWLFVARREGPTWRVALEGEPAFAELAAQAPILTANERRVLGGGDPDAAPAAAANRAGGGTGGGFLTEGGTAYGDRRTAMGLPFTVGQAWRFTSGPHPMSGPVLSSIDLSGGDGVVRAPAPGIAYTMCGGRGWVRIIHARGYSTDYYHLVNNIHVTGQVVQAGAYLGHIGNDVSCGGHSTGAHVHFALRRNGQYEPITRYAFGGWTVVGGASARVGVMVHGSTVAQIGDEITNYGPLALNQGVVDTDGGHNLNRRSGPGDTYRIVGQAPDGTTLNVACSVRGTGHAGRSAYTTTLWDKLVDGSYVSDAFVATGTSGPVRGYCP